jgi:hypothetical protein
MDGYDALKEAMILVSGAYFVTRIMVGSKAGVSWAIAFDVSSQEIARIRPFGSRLLFPNGQVSKNTNSPTIREPVFFSKVA